MNNPPPAIDCIIIPGRIPPREIGFLNALLDDHEGICVVRTELPEVGRMEFWVAPDMLDYFYRFADFIRSEYSIPFELYDPVAESTEIIAERKNSTNPSE